MHRILLAEIIMMGQLTRWDGMLFAEQSVVVQSLAIQQLSIVKVQPLPVNVIASQQIDLLLQFLLKTISGQPPFLIYIRCSILLQPTELLRNEYLKINWNNKEVIDFQKGLPTKIGIQIRPDIL